MTGEILIICDVLRNHYQDSFEKGMCFEAAILKKVAVEIAEELSLHCPECSDRWDIIANRCGSNCTKKGA